MTDILSRKLPGSFLLILLVMVAVCGLPRSVWAVDPVPAHLDSPHASLLPWLEYYLDESGTADIEEITLQEQTLAFRRLGLMGLPDSSGTFWLRFTLAPLQDNERPETWLLDMGQSVPGKPELYLSSINDLTGRHDWQSVQAGDRQVFILPEAGAEPKTCYLRLTGTPGIWFEPMLRTPHDAANNWANMGRYAALIALGAVMLFCLLRGESAQWRLWTGLFVATTLGHGLLGLPASEHGYIALSDMPAAVLPGLALMLLPHVGRHMLHAQEVSRSVDIQLILLTLVGAVVALAPLMPGFAWIARYLELWPLVSICFLFTALVAVFQGIRGSRRYLLGCLVPAAITGLAIVAAKMGVSSEFMASCPLLGVAVGALILTTGRISAAKVAENATLPTEQPLDDPNLRIVSADAYQENTPYTQVPVDTNHPLLTATATHQLEDALRLPLDRLMREGAALGKCSLPPAVRQYSDKMLEQARRIADIISNPSVQGDPEQIAHEEENSFNLQHLMRDAHDAVAPLAETANIGLAWYMPPHLGHMYKGASQSLKETLCMLLESAVRATMHGAVHFSVRRVPESEDPGHLLFTITDTGSGMPPKERSSLALSRAWELAGAHKGYLGVESSPHGATIAFTLHLTCLEQDEAETALRKKPMVIICAGSAIDRQGLIHMLEGLKCRPAGARTLTEAQQLHKGECAILVICLDDMALKAQAEQIQQFHRQSAETGLPYCRILAITPDNSQWNQLSELGFTHALAEPVDEQVLRQTVQDILDDFTNWVADQQSFRAEDGFDHAQGIPTPETAPADSFVPETPGLSAPDGQQANTPADIPDLVLPKMPGQPSLPNLLPEPRPTESPMQIPDLTALPDLLHFAEILGKPANKQPEPPQSMQMPPMPGLITPGAVPPVNPPMPEMSLSPLPAMEDIPPISDMPGVAPDTFTPVEFPEPEWNQIPTPDSVVNEVEQARNSGDVPPIAPPTPSGDDEITDAEFFDTPKAVAEPEPEPVEPPKPVRKAGITLKPGPKPAPKEGPKISMRPASGKKPAQAKNEPVSAAATTPKTSDPVVDTASIPKTEKIKSAPKAPAKASIKLRPAAHSKPQPVKKTEEPANPATAESPAAPHETPVSQVPSPTQQDGTPEHSGGDFMDFLADMTPDQQNATDATQAGKPDENIDALLTRLDTAMRDTRKAFAQSDCAGVSEAAHRIVQECDAYGLHVLGGIAGCVERAGQAEDLSALKDLLPDLYSNVERNRISFKQQQ